MIQLIMILLGTDYLRERWRGLMLIGVFCFFLGVFLFVDALDGALYFPLHPFAFVLFIDGVSTLIVANSGIGGQRTLRYIKGWCFVIVSIVIFSDKHDGNVILSIIFGFLLLFDGVLQITAAFVVRFNKWQLSFVGGVIEIVLAIFFFQPYPDYYVGTVPYCLALGLIFGGWNVILISRRVRVMKINPAINEFSKCNTAMVREYIGPPTNEERCLTVHIWTPSGSAKDEIIPHPIIDRYIAAVDKNGVISTGHAALEAPDDVYISLYPAVDIDRSPDQFARILRATVDNDVDGFFQPNYKYESSRWCHSNVKIRIRNYNAENLLRFCEAYKKNKIYNLTSRNCSSSVAFGLEAALEGVVGKPWVGINSWYAFRKILTTPELWIAIHIRKRAMTMAWTPGLVMDYARALSMLADPRKKEKIDIKKLIITLKRIYLKG